MSTHDPLRSLTAGVLTWRCDLQRWTVMAAGGHFAAAEEPRVGRASVAVPSACVRANLLRGRIFRRLDSYVPKAFAGGSNPSSHLLPLNPFG